MKQRLQNILHDLGLTVLIGAALDAALGLAAFVVSWLLYAAEPLSRLYLMRGVFFFAGAFGLLICAGLLLMPHAGDKVRQSDSWTGRFRAFGLLPVAGVLAVLLLAAGVFLDSFCY